MGTWIIVLSPALKQPVSNNCRKTCRFNRDKWRLSFSKAFRLLLVFIGKKRKISVGWQYACLKNLQRRGVPHSLAGFSPFKRFQQFLHSASICSSHCWGGGEPTQRAHLETFSSCWGCFRLLPSSLSTSIWFPLADALFPGLWTLTVEISFCGLLWFCLHIKAYLFALLTLRYGVLWDLLVHTVWEQSPRHQLPAKGVGLSSGSLWSPPPVGMAAGSRSLTMYCHADYTD